MKLPSQQSASPASEQLYRIRHSLAHLLAQAVQEEYPGVQLGIGPPVEHGFYYDFVFPEPISQEVLPRLEQRMRRMIQENQHFQCFERAAEEALQWLREQDEPYKVELCEALIARGESISFYQNGPFVDMCQGPHVEYSGEIPADAFCLDSIAGAYWRGDENNIMMSRIYGLAFASKADLDDFLARRDLAQERDHRKLGRELQLFMFSEEVGKGLPLWLPNGVILRESLEQLAREVEQQHDYKRVATPHIARSELYVRSGHLPYYKDSMFPPMCEHGEEFYLKPMNCPHHHMICKQLLQSYRDLPLRLAEFGQVYRNEKSGELSGLMRVRGLCINDAHIYCGEEHVRDELLALMEMHKSYYDLFGLSNYWVRLSVNDPEHSKYVENPEGWQHAIAVLRDVLKLADLPYEEVPGEAAFYGPKIDFQVSNLLGREATASTGQLDFVSGHRFGLSYIDAQGNPQVPYIIHRAPLGSHERFLSFLIEHYGGAFPTWMAPVQVMIIPVAADVFAYAEQLQAQLRAAQIRAVCDLSADSFRKKIRNGSVQKIPNLLIVGRQEQEQGSVTLRRYGQKEQLSLKVDELQARLLDEIAHRRG